MNWQNQTINLGTVKSGVKHTIFFQATQDLDIVNMTVSCGCTTPKYLREEKKLKVIYTPGNIPVHLRQAGKFSTTKTITLHYSDGSKDVLSFSAIVTK